MPTRQQNIKLGVFVLATLLVFTLVLVVVANLRFWKTEHTYFVVTEDSVAGLEIGSPVTMRGVDVGRIDDIRLDPRHYDRVEITLVVDGRVPIPRDAIAYIQFSGLTGLRVIDISDGSTRTGVLPPGSEIPVGATALALLETRAEELAENATEIMERTQAFVENLVDLSESLSEGIDAERIASILEQVDDILATMASASRELEGTLGESRQSLRGVFEDVQSASGELEELLGRGNRVLRANDEDVRSAVRDLREAARNLEALSRQVRRNPGMLLRSRPPRERELP